MMFGENRKNKEPRLLNCYYCEVPMIETKLTRTKIGITTILDCGKCIEKPKKKVKLLKRWVDRCQRV